MSDQTTEELEMVFDADGPVAVAASWLMAIFRDEDLNAAWHWTDIDVRTALVDEFLASPDVEVAADDAEDVRTALISGTADQADWNVFTAAVIGHLRTSWNFDQDFDPSRLGVASRPRLIAPDVEAVVFVPTSGEVEVYRVETPIPDALTLHLRRSSVGWLVTRGGHFGGGAS